MKENQTIQYLYSLKRFGPKLGLERMEKLLDTLGRPEKTFKSILVAGTNGKGSTVATIYSVLRKAGFRVGRYISPHITSLNERIEVDGKQISDDELFRIVDRIKEKTKTEHQTFFEFTTAAAFVYFKEKKVDFAVIEVGMGGRLDATNTVTPIVSVITNISLEHMHILGDTIEKIAYEKAGIVKSNGFVVTAAEGKALETITRICKERNARCETCPETCNTGSIGRHQLFDIVYNGNKYTKLEFGLLGEHQLKNAACAIAVVENLKESGIKIPENALRDGLRDVVWPGRLEFVSEEPNVILDCAKDVDAAEKLAKAVKDQIKPKRLILVISISSDKNIPKMIGALAPLADEVIATAHKVMERAIDPQLLAKEISRYKKVIIIPDVKDAVKKAIEMAGKDGTVLVTGSVFTAAEARELWFPVKTELGLDFNDTPKK